MDFFSKLKKKLFKKNIDIFYLDKLEDLDFFYKEMGQQDMICIDTEFDWRKTYFPKLSLVQISTKKNIFLIDFLKIKPSNFLKQILDNKDILKIFHSVKSDATILSTSLKTKMKNIFDIQIAEKVLSENEDIKNYGYITHKYTGVLLEKSETNSNWLRRPLTEVQINYAADDVKYMFDIFSAQKKILTKINAFNLVLKKSQKETLKGEEDLLASRLKRNSKKLNFFQKKIFVWRENKAKEKNVPPSFIMSSKDLIKLSKITKEQNFEKKVFKVLGDSGLVEDYIKSVY